jgi:hypothetical protein
MKKYLLLAFCFAIISCKNSTDTVVQGQSVIMPLAIGNTWIYIDNGYDSNGHLIVPTPSDTLLISDTLSYGKDIIYIPQNRHIYYVNRADGLRIRYDGYFDETFIAKYPAKAGDIFRHDRYLITKESSPDPIGVAAGDLIVSSTIESVTVPAGTFICYKYNEDYYDTASHQLLDRFNTYYAPNVGMIKEEDFYLDSASQTLKLAQSHQLTKVILH